MRKLFKNIFVCTAAAVVAVGGVALSACKETTFQPLEGNDYESNAPAVSNGGFAVEYGKYVYFINGATTYEDDNTYGTPVKGALMRITAEDLKNRKNNVQTVIPSLIVSGDTTAGFFIYNNRVYYATPNNVKNMSGEVDKDWLEFKSASLNGGDIKTYFRLQDNAAVFRFVQTKKDGPVYLMYNGKDPDDDDSNTAIRSYNTDTGVLTTIAESANAYVFNTNDKTDPYVYYTMSVKDNIDSDAPISLNYNQIYRACADVTKETASYHYTWDQEYLDDNDGKEPYVNLGTLVLDGVGKPHDGGDVTEFTHDYKDGQGNVIAEPVPPVGYTYTLQTYSTSGEEKGIYFKREDITSAGDTEGGGASLYYLSQADIDATDAGGKRTWNSISGNKDKISDPANGKLDVVAKSAKTTDASASALFYIDEAEGYKHHYVYVKDENIIRADVKADASVDETVISYDASGATLVTLDERATETDPYNYVWFTRTNGGGTSVERAVYNGEKENYETLGFVGADGERNNEPYKALKILDLQHKSSWYPIELIEDMVLYADAESYGESSYDYIGAVSLSKDGKYLNNEEFEKQVNDYWDFFMDSDKKTGYFAKLTSDGKTNLSNALTYYFKTGKTDVFYSNIDDAVDLGKKENFLYTDEEQKAFKEYSENAGDAKTAFEQFLAKDGRTGKFEDYNKKSSFITSLGTVNEADDKAMTDYWKGYLKNFTVEEEVKTGLEDWEIALAVVIPVLGLAGIGIAIWLILRHKKKKAQAAGKPERMRVDTTDDKSLDVYGDHGEEEQTPPADGSDGNDEE